MRERAEQQEVCEEVLLVCFSHSVERKQGVVNRLINVHPQECSGLERVRLEERMNKTEGGTAEKSRRCVSLSFQCASSFFLTHTSFCPHSSNWTEANKLA